MSSNILVQRICENCKKEFIAKTTVTRFCSSTCCSRAYKSSIKLLKIQISNSQTQQIKAKPIENLKNKEFLTVRDLAMLLNSSTKTIYRIIQKGKINAVNIAERKTLIQRSEIDKLFISNSKIEQNGN